MNGFTLQALVRGIAGRLDMGGAVHKACFLRLVVLLCVERINFHNVF